MPAKYGSQDSPAPASQKVTYKGGGGNTPSTSGGDPPTAPKNTSAKYGLYGLCAEGTSQDDKDSDD